MLDISHVTKRNYGLKMEITITIHTVGIIPHHQNLHFQAQHLFFTTLVMIVMARHFRSPGGFQVKQISATFLVNQA